MSFYDAEKDNDHPYPENATLNNSILTIEFNELLAEKSHIRNRFVIMQGNQRIDIERIDLGNDKKTLVLALSTPLDLFNEQISIAYRGYKSDKMTNVIEDINGNDLLAFSGFTVDKISADYIYEKNLPIQDLDGNGIVDNSGITGYQLLNGERTISLFRGLDQRIEIISDSSYNDWTIVASMPSDQGFILLLEGREKLSGNYAEWQANSDGRITSKIRNTEWLTLDMILSTSVWENRLSKDIKRDGLIYFTPIKVETEADILSTNYLMNNEPSEIEDQITTSLEINSNDIYYGDTIEYPLIVESMQ